MNIICDGATLKTVKKQVDHEYSLDELAFFISKQLHDYKFYLVIQNGNDLDAVELKQVNSTSKQYYNYSCVMNHPMKITSGTCSISLLGINHGNVADIFNSESIEIAINNITYNFKSQICLIEEFSKTSADLYRQTAELYQKVVEMTKLNISVLSQAESEVSGT